MTRPLIGVASGWGVERALQRAGAEVVDIDRMSDLEWVGKLLDAVVLTGGGDVDPKRYGQAVSKDTYGIDRERDRLEFAIVDIARQNGLNIMGICRGSQLLNIAHGGTLFQDIDDITLYSHWGMVAEVLFRKQASMTPLLSSLEVFGTHYHHQAIDRVGDGLIAAAWSEDAIIECIESVPGSDNYMLGTQFHPEMDYQKDEDAMALFEHFVNRTRGIAERRLDTEARAREYRNETNWHSPVTYIAGSNTTVYHTGFGGSEEYDVYGRRMSQVDIINGDERGRMANTDDAPDLAFLSSLDNEEDEFEYWDAKDLNQTDRRSSAWASFCSRTCPARGGCWAPEYCSPLDDTCEEMAWVQTERGWTESVKLDVEATKGKSTSLVKIEDVTDASKLLDNIPIIGTNEGSDGPWHL